jgi:hypothetical protein
VFTVSDAELEKAAGGTAEAQTYHGTGVATICVPDRSPISEFVYPLWRRRRAPRETHSNRQNGNSAVAYGLSMFLMPARCLADLLSHFTKR